MRNITQFIPLRTKRITTNDSLEKIVFEAVEANKSQLDEGDILAVTSKIVSICEQRLCRYKSIKKLVKQEADLLFPGEMPLTIKDGIFIPSAGIDTSNIPDGYAVLWPENPQKSSDNLLKILKQRTNIQKLGVMIIDSHIRPLREGVTSFCLAFNGFEGIEDVRGRKDLHGKPLKITKRAIADSLAAACSVLMGEADEKIPLVLIREAPVTFTERKISAEELKRPPKNCLFEKLYPSKIKAKN